MKRIFKYKYQIKISLFIIFGIIFLLILYGVYIEPYSIEIRHLYIKDQGINKYLAGKTVVHISDLHIGYMGKIEEKLLGIIESLDPDLIFLTGDYVKWKGNYLPALAFISRLEAKIGIWAVMGDYDYSSPRKSCIFCHEKYSGKFTKQHKVKFLRNSMDKLSLPNGDIWIGGIDLEGNPNSISGARLCFLKDKSPAIILCHTPFIFDYIERSQDLLILSGDTHGGQIRLPSWLWDLLGYRKCARFNQGLFIQGKKKMYVSRGIGTSHLPIRILSRPELVVIHFSPFESEEVL